MAACSAASGQAASAALLPVFEVHRHACVLDVLGSGAEVLGEDPASEPTFKGAFEKVVAAALLHLQQQDAAQQADLIRGLFELANQLLVFNCGVVLRSPALGQLVSTAIAALRLKELDSVRAAAFFLVHLLDPGEKLASSPAWQACRGNIGACFQPNLQAAVASILFAAVATCPLQLVKLVGYCLACLQLADPQTTGLVEHTLGAREFRDVALGGGGGLREDDLALFGRLLLRQPIRPRPQYEALFYDFSRAARGEATRDVLLTYDL